MTIHYIKLQALRQLDMHKSGTATASTVLWLHYSCDKMCTHAWVFIVEELHLYYTKLLPPLFDISPNLKMIKTALNKNGITTKAQYTQISAPSH